MPEPDAHIATAASVGTDSGALERRIASLERELAQLRGREAGWREERERLLSALAEAEREVAELPALRNELEGARDAAYWLAVTRSSLWWRMGAPGRALGRLARRRRSEP